MRSRSRIKAGNLNRSNSLVRCSNWPKGKSPTLRRTEWMWTNGTKSLHWCSASRPKKWMHHLSKTCCNPCPSLPWRSFESGFERDCRMPALILRGSRKNDRRKWRTSNPGKTLWRSSCLTKSGFRKKKNASAQFQLTRRIQTKKSRGENWYNSRRIVRLLWTQSSTLSHRMIAATIRPSKY